MTSKFTVATIAAMMLLGGQSIVQAADLGGNCCADLEGRIAELEATTARKGNVKVTLEVSGQVNEAVMFHDIDGSAVPQASIIGSNGLNETRVRFRGEGKISQEWSAGFLIEIGTSGDLHIRHEMLYIKSKSVGMLALGKTSTATDGIFEIDLSESGHVSGPLDLQPALGVFAPGFSLIPSFDGGRKQVVKWVSPEGMPVSLSASITDEDTYDVALRAAGDLGQFRLAGGVGYRKDQLTISWAPPGIEAETISGSFSVMHVPSGLFVSGSAGQIKAAGYELRGYAGKAGFKRKFSPVGDTTLYAEYGRIESPDVAFKPDYFGIGFNQSIDGAAMDLYINGRRYSSDGLTSPDEATVVIVGARIQF